MIVKDLSRLGRNMIESGEYIEQIFPRMGVRFISVTDRFDSLRDDADISIQLKNFANEAYARDISKKIRAVKRTQQLAGKWTTGTPPYGYMLDPDDKYHLFPDPQTGPIVLAIFRMVAENHTLHFIAKTLNEQGVPSPGRYLYDIGLRKTEKFKNAMRLLFQEVYCMSKVDYREILRLDSLHYSRKRISISIGSSHHTVKDVLDTATQKGITWPLDNDVTNAELEALLFPDKRKTESIYAELDYAYIHRELAKTGVTLTLLWEEYCRTCHESGRTPYMSTQFGDKYRKWARIRNLSSMLKNGQDRISAQKQEPIDNVSHGFTRGAAYYRKGGEQK